MKILIAAIAATICLVLMNIFVPSTTDQEPPKLIIEAYMFDKDVTDPNSRDEFTKFSFEPLELGTSRILAPVIGADVVNLCFYFEFDGGTVEVISEDEDVQLSKTSSNDPKVGEKLDERIFAFDLKIGGSGYMSMNPLGSGCGTFMIVNENMQYMYNIGYIGKEYILTVNAYDFANENSPVATAKIKLTQLKDNVPNENKPGSSRFFSAELVSYEQSDKYMFN